ncbi:MAG: hypothetical protein ABIS50_26825 [Luteolibacter sp.]|uniref:hypothetical protein n=1 Tax=Luteolibacter sp. TaxID=1962973 RepID=UPI0032642EB0
MAELEANSVIILLSACVGLLILALLLIFRISSRVHRIESLLSQNISRSEPGDDTPSVAETSAGGAFEAFLNEDPSRRSLTKGEQFSAYRQWRHEKGMNWSNS